MNSEPENFESLRRLLVLKRYEQPPPGYFHEFSRQITLRLSAAPGAVPSGLEGWLGQVSWLQRLWAALEGNPYAAGAFGVGVCGLLVSAVLWADRFDAQQMAFPGIGVSSVLVDNRQPLAVPALERASLGASPGGFVPQPSGSSLFQDIQRLRPASVTPLVAYPVEGGN
jgi:hypothetical protein